MPKGGLLFEQVVADIVRAFDSTVDVIQGEWVEGPDGRRDRDVSFAGISGGKPFRALIECKDYNPDATGPVGIGLIDALDSKRHDLQIDFPMICSNAGFTAPAIAKAQRVGISTIGALRMGDERLRFEVSDVIYSRKLTIPIDGIKVDVAPIPAQADGPLDGREVTYGGHSIQDWVTHRVHMFVQAIPIVNGTLRCTHKFIRPLPVHSPRFDFEITDLNFLFSITGAWYRHEVTIDATNGFYDWVRKRTRMPPGPGQFQIRNLDVNGGTRVERPPDYVLTPPPPLPDDTMMGFIKLHAPLQDGPAPEIDEFLVPADRVIEVRPLDAAAYISTPGFVPIP